MTSNIPDDNKKEINDVFEASPAKLQNDVSAYIKHDQILDSLLKNVGEVDFELIAFSQIELIRTQLNEVDKQILQCEAEKKDTKGLESKKEGLNTELKNFKLKQMHYEIIAIEQVIELAKKNNWGICKHNNSVYLYNGAYWSPFDEKELQKFFGKAAEKMGFPQWEARYFMVQERLFKQFLAVANLPKPDVSKDFVIINLKNGTFEIGSNKQELRPPKSEDFLTYQLPFNFDPKAKAPLFKKYLNLVQPDVQRQNILSEYLGYLFIKHNRLKLEKTLLLYGTGANGKSVFFEVVNALLGNENVSTCSLQSLTNENGYSRAILGDKLVNYATEISGKLETSIFKQLVSGEPVEARLPYGKPFTLCNYAKLIFNCNDLPKDVEQSHAYFRRFLIVPFEITIPEKEQDKELSKKIIDSELNGVFNWVLEGLNRLIAQKNFTESESVAKQLDDYKLSSDSVLMFLNEEGYYKWHENFETLKELYSTYRRYCSESGFHCCSMKSFSERLRAKGFKIERKSQGNVVYIKNDRLGPTGFTYPA